jgi:DNA (cytosine-5)-methyltransferase 1
MVLRVDESDPRCPFVAGMEDIPVEEVLCLRECVLTNKPYPQLSFRDGPRCAFPLSLTQKEIKQQIFLGGRLACRVVNIVISKNKAKPHAGVIRHLHAIETDLGAAPAPAQGPGLSRKEPITMDDDEDDQDFVIVDNLRNGKRSAGPNSAGDNRRKRRPTKQPILTYGDVFCGAGGGSRGATQAGLHVKWGLDNDDEAIQAYQSNHPAALPFQCNAHNFPPRGYTNEELRVDILHLSPPCCFFSPAQ